MECPCVGTSREPFHLVGIKFSNTSAKFIGFCPTCSNTTWRCSEGILSTLVVGCLSSKKQHLWLYVLLKLFYGLGLSLLRGFRLRELWHTIMGRLLDRPFIPKSKSSKLWKNLTILRLPKNSPLWRFLLEACFNQNHAFSGFIPSMVYYSQTGLMGLGLITRFYPMVRHDFVGCDQPICAHHAHRL